MTDDFIGGYQPIEQENIKLECLVDKLKEENAILKEKLKPENCLKLLAKEGYVKFTSNNLTKAIDLIKDFLLMAKVEHLENRYETVDEAKQFLSEVEE